MAEQESLGGTSSGLESAAAALRGDAGDQREVLDADRWGGFLRKWGHHAARRQLKLDKRNGEPSGGLRSIFTTLT